MQPRPVLPVTWRERATAPALLAGLYAALGTCAFWLIRPTAVSETVGDATTYRVEPDQILAGAGLLGIAALIAIRLLVGGAPATRPRGPAGIGLTLALVLGVPLWQQWNCRLVVTPDSMTAARAGGLFAGEPVRLRFAELSDLRLGRDGRRNSTQYAHTLKRQVVELDFSPLVDGAFAQIRTNATAHGVRVER